MRNRIYHFIFKTTYFFTQGDSARSAQSGVQMSLCLWIPFPPSILNTRCPKVPQGTVAAKNGVTNQISFSGHGASERRRMERNQWTHSVCSRVETQRDLTKKVAANFNNLLVIGLLEAATGTATGTVLYNTSCCIEGFLMGDSHICKLINDSSSFRHSTDFLGGFFFQKPLFPSPSSLPPFRFLISFHPTSLHRSTHDRTDTMRASKK